MSEQYYSLGTNTAEQYIEIHDQLCEATNGIANIPDRVCTCTDEKEHSLTRGSFSLTDAEATALKADPRIKFINIDYSKYPETYKAPPDELYASAPKNFNRYKNTVKVYKEMETSNTLPGTPDSTDINRTNWGTLRGSTLVDPWIEGGDADNVVKTSKIPQWGDGKHVDVIVADDGAGWIGHPEFNRDTEGEKPNGYVGGNLLPGNGSCDVLDLVLDAPYYLDPDYFNADPDNRLITRWDGTIVPVESFARGWWTSTGNRSSVFNAKFPSAGIVSSITSSYTRAYCNGTNTSPSTVGQHCTPCMALTYGRTQGWAYNANKWALNLYGTNGTDIEPGFDLQKIFHNTKPVNPAYGTQDPTVSSNSWGYRASKGDNPGWYHFREDSPVTYAGTGAEPTFISHMGSQGDSGRWKSEMKTNSLTTALDELIDSGVIFVCAAGNSNQKQTNWGHPDFDNYISANSDDTIEESSYFEFSVETTGTTNRRGFPQQGGKHDLSDGLGSDFFKRELTVNGVRIVGAGSVGGQVAVPDAWLEKVGRMFELFLDKNAAGINEEYQRNLIKTLSGDTGTYHAGLPTLQRVARGAGGDYSTNFLTDDGITFWNLSPLFDSHVANDMVWYLNSTGDGYGDGDNDAQEVIEHVFHTLHMHGLPADDIKLYQFLAPDWQSGDLYAAMEEAYDAGKWDSSGYGGNAWKTDADAFEVAAKEYLYLLNFCMFEYTELWDGGSLAPEWTDDMRTQAGIQANNPLGYAFHNTWIAPVISKPSLATIRSIFQDGNTPEQDDPSLAGVSGYVVSNGSTQDPEYNNGPLISNGEVAYKTINIGALNDQHATGPKERKVGYSDRGNAIDVYAPADGTLAANRSYTPEGRYPDTYPGFTANSGSGAGVPEETGFSGTSAACPVAAGFISTLVGLNRNWGWREVKDYFESLNEQSDANFYKGSVSTSATDANWLDYDGLEGGRATVMYQDANLINQTTFPKRQSKISNGLQTSGITINYINKFDRGR
jgi:hypothetical protein